MRSPRLLALVCLLATLPLGPSGDVPLHAAQFTPTQVTYLAPQWDGIRTESLGTVATEAARLRGIVAGHDWLKVGFTAYLYLEMNDWTVDLTDSAALRRNLGTFEQQIDDTITRARSQNLIVVFTLLTPIRSWVDGAQTASFVEDRRVMQWYADNTVATGWWSYSRYARRQYEVREAYMREAAKILAAKIAQYPETLVAIAGDGEVEMSLDRASESGGPVLADYSPFMIAEFRDWLRATGLYATGSSFAGEAWAQASRYATDASPAVDTNGDGHTLNGDFGTTFTTWELKHFDWSLTDSSTTDPRRIPSSVYTAPGFQLLPNERPTGFDAPRTAARGNSWWELWDTFRAHVIWRHNRDLARWMTTSQDSNGNRIPADRWFSYQIPADYLSGSTPANPNPRLVTSASPWWTANVLPYAGMGFTAFATHTGGGVYASTLAGLLPAIQPCATGAVPPTCLDGTTLADMPWGIFEWNSAVPSTTDATVYLNEVRLLRRYRPRVLVPWRWLPGEHEILGTGFEPALRQLSTYLQQGWAPPLALSPTALQFTVTRVGTVLAHSTTAQEVVTGQARGATVDWSASTAASWLTVASGSGHGDGKFSVALAPAGVVGLAAGTHTATVRVSAPGSIEGTRDVTVTLRVIDTATSEAPFGVFDTPVHGSTVAGSIAVTGWALDDVGIDRVEIWRDAIPNDPAPPFRQDGHPADGKVFIANGTFVPGTRDDIVADPVYGRYPFAHRAGWGYLLLTWGFPNSNGPFRLTAIAWDTQGQSTVIGTKDITVNNAAATRPFGSIDVPAYGGTFSGHNFTFGWALTPNAGCTMRNGQLYMTIDSQPPSSVVSTPVTYGSARTDIAASFPGFSDSSAAGGAAALDSRRYPNGTYQIGWLVYDSCGNGEGIGSRFFSIVNQAGARPAAAADGPPAPGPDQWRRWAAATPASEGLWLVRGIATAERSLRSGDRVWLSQTGRIEVHVTRPGTPPEPGVRYAAWFENSHGPRALPLGSSFDPTRGAFYWQPVPGFLGAYRLRIARLRDDVAEATWLVPIDIAPGLDDAQVQIDLARASDGLVQVAGWALDPLSVSDAGIGHVHVWARPRGRPDATPVFLGAATQGLERPDVGAVYGAQFDNAGFSLSVSAALDSGEYELAVYTWNSRTAAWSAARTVVIQLR